LRNYPEKLRRVRYFDKDKNEAYTFLTNNFTIPALTVAEFYKWRWKIELFFKWIKQHLRIKSFYGTSENAIKTQIWIAISIYVLIAIVKKRLNLQIALYTFLQILSVNAFEKAYILQLVAETDYKEQGNIFSNQLNLYD
jgi:IS4 transposase